VCSVPRKQLYFSKPVLPDFLSSVQISGIGFQDTSAVVVAQRELGETQVSVPVRPDDLEVIIND
jgi:hypothetical protein